MRKQINNKHCPACKQDVHIEDFYKHAYGYSSKCKPCTIAYNTEYRKNRVPGPRPKKRSLEYIHRKLLSERGPRDSIFYGRYIHTRKEFTLYLGSGLAVLDGELMYGDICMDDIIYTLHNRHMKLMRRESAESVPDNILSKITLVRNSCGVPIEVRFVLGLVSLDQYFLWMDKPRKLLKSEVAEQLSLSTEILDFLLPEKTPSNPILTAPVILKNPSTNSSQVVDNTPTTYEYTEE